MSEEKKEQGAKPGYKTTEFWLTVAATLVAGLLASGAVETDSQLYQALAFAASALSALGYTACRTWAKTSSDKKTAAEAMAKAGK